MTQADLAKAAGLSAVSIGMFEKGGDTRDSNRMKIKKALETTGPGVEFIEKNGGGAGVRLKR